MKTRPGNIRLRIRYKRRSDLVTLAALLALALVTATFLGYLAWGQKKAAASSSAPAAAAPAASAPMRKYYVTQSAVDGNEVLTACAPGYHMASLWEILDPSNLAYDTDLGFTRADSGAGPPAAWGWVRTGWESEADRGVGQDNCLTWSTDAYGYHGMTATLPNEWTGDWEDIHVWDVRTGSCGDAIRVWCVEDYPTFVYLPLVVKD